MEENKTILAVDDSATNNFLLESVLTNRGHDVIVVKSAKAAKEVLDKKKVALVLLDLYMPEINGFMFLEQIKKDPKNQDIPVIIISAANDTESRNTTKKLGAVDFIGKPIDLQEVLEKINRHLNIED